MHKPKIFISLKWKFAFGFGLILMSLYSGYFYFAYREAADNFARSRTVAQENQVNIARALTEDSFLDLERFVESILLVNNVAVQQEQTLVSLFDTYWQHWQVIWGLENAIFYNQQGTIVKQWGSDIATKDDVVQSVLLQELPVHQIICEQGCFHQVLTPILFHSEVTGVLSISLSLSDTLLNYQNAIHSDIGVIVDEHKLGFSAVTHAEKNNQLWHQVRSIYPLSAFTNKALNYQRDNKYYELRAFAISAQYQQAPYYVIINDITNDYNNLQKKFSTLAMTGLLGLLGVIFILFINIHFALSRVVQLSKALPFLVEHKYQAFRENIATRQTLFFADELAQLTQTAIDVVHELEVLENDIKHNNSLLLRKSSELEEERDFISQLIDVAPIIIITQDIQGNILTVNQEGQNALHCSSEKLVGKNFADFIPDAEIEHLHKLMQLRLQKKHQEFSFNGRLLVDSDDIIYIDWIHTVLRAKKSEQDPIILSLGVDVTERHQSDQQLVWMATHDQLTGLSNRRHFQNELESMLAVAERYQEQIALFYLDLDQFKVINDTHGHQAGDRLLQLITRVLSREVRETDLFSRIGGDEFTLVVPSATEDGVKSLTNKLLHALKDINYTINDQPHPISFSIGVAIYPQHGTTQQELLANADLAMYQAKKTGRARYHIYSPEFEYQALLTEQLRWKQIIEQAIEQDEFVLFYQPILDIKQKKISHYECLLRIEKEDGSILMPGDFIEHAEQLGIIDQIDQLVLRKAVEQHLAFQKIGNNARLAVNLSGRSMNDMEILPHIEQVLSQPGVQSELIIFEITETSAVSNFLSAKSLITQIKALGCHFALDDFGVGFSSFYYLKSLPVDYVKIDGSFVKQMDVSEEDRIFVKVLTEVSQTFGKKIIAEFVENKQILNLLEQQGVDYAQGYFISKPIRNPLDLTHVKGLD
jgi:diguanylate cyclase (GGDEF)-like protein/PAS domain S-box-containing protein